MPKTPKANISKGDKKSGVRHYFVDDNGNRVKPTPEQEQAWKDKAWEDLWAMPQKGKAV